MWIEGLLELKDSIDKHGLRLGVVFTLYAIYRKERRNKRLDQRDVDLFHNQLIIMRKLGVEQEWRGQLEISNDTEVQSLKRLYRLSRKGFHPREGKRMPINKVWLSGVIAYILGQVALKYGFKFDVAWADTAAEIIITYIVPAAVAWLNRHKGDVKNDNQKPTVTIGDNR